MSLRVLRPIFHDQFRSLRVSPDREFFTFVEPLVSFLKEKFPEFDFHRRKGIQGKKQSI